MLLYADKPRSLGVENALKRARQLLDIRYTPVRPLPVVEAISSGVKDKPDIFLENYSPAGFPRQGVLYSSVRRSEKYVGFNVLPETYISALSNPYSVMYTRPIKGTGQNVHNYYGIVCSCFAAYVHDLPYRATTGRWTQYLGMVEVDGSRLENLELCDLVLKPTAHVAVITGIERDAEGKVHYITVAESTLPVCRETRFASEEFITYWYNRGYSICRNTNVDQVTYTPDPFVPVEGDPVTEAFVNPTLMTDFGNKANYRLDELVEITVFDETYPTVEVAGPNGSITSHPVTEGKVILSFTVPGFYTACCTDGARKSASVEWCMTNLQLTLNKATYARGESLKAAYSNAAGDPVVAWECHLSSSDKSCGAGLLNSAPSVGELDIPAPSDSGELQIYLMARNKYGVYTSKYQSFTVLPNTEQ